jgi:hypothetical protein
MPLAFPFSQMTTKKASPVWQGLFDLTDFPTSLFVIGIIINDFLH